MADPFEIQYENSLYRMEVALVHAYQTRPELTDWDVKEAVNGLLRIYQAEQQNRPVPALRLPPSSREAFDNLKMVCEFELGHATILQAENETAPPPFTPITPEELVACLKRIRRSIETWQKELGRRGYYDFVSQYVDKGEIK